MAMSSAAEVPRSIGGVRLRWPQLLVWLATAGALAMLVIGELVKGQVAGGHGQFHAVFALVALAPALVILQQRPTGSWTTTPVVVGFAILALTQLIEGVGGFGYGPGNDVRVNDLAQIHDLGTSIAPIGLVAAALGVTAGVAQVLRRRTGMALALVATVLVLAGLGFVVAKLIGM